MKLYRFLTFGEEGKPIWVLNAPIRQNWEFSLKSDDNFKSLRCKSIYYTIYLGLEKQSI